MKYLTSARKDTAEIGKVVTRMTVLADWMKENNPACTAMTLWPKDFVTIRRNPHVAAGFQIVISTTGVLTWRGFTLTTRRSINSVP